MNRLNKVLREKGLVWDAPDFPNRIENNNCQKLVAITNGFIITAWYSEVMPTQLHLYDRNFNLIGGQDLSKDEDYIYYNLFGNNPWSTYVNLPVSDKHKDFIDSLS